MSDESLEAIVGLHRELERRASEAIATPEEARRANTELRERMREQANYLPEIEEYLHYRSVDVSSIKELVRRWYPDVLAQRGWKAGTHRALDDIRESIVELRLYRELVFSTPEVVRERLAAKNAAAAVQVAEP